MRTGRWRIVALVVGLVAVAVACNPVVAADWNSGQSVVVNVDEPTWVAALAPASNGGAWMLAGPDVATDGVRRPTFLERLDAAGEPVASFGAAGRVSVAGMDDVMPAADGGAFLIAKSRGIVSLFSYRVSLSVKKLLPSGATDTAFGTGGSIYLSYESMLQPRPVLVTVGSDGRLIAVVGPGLYRFTTAGQPDPTFGSNGAAAAPDNADLLASLGGSPVVAIAGSPASVRRIDDAGATAWDRPLPGTTTIGQLRAFGDSLVAATPVTSGSIVVARVSSAGALDPTWDGDGLRTIGIPYPAGIGPGLGPLVVPGDGSLVIPFYLQTGRQISARILRFTSDGTYDPRWGQNGGILLDGTQASHVVGVTGGIPITTLGGGVVAAGEIPTTAPGGEVPSKVGIVIFGADGRPVTGGNGPFRQVSSGAVRDAFASHVVGLPDGGAVAAITDVSGVPDLNWRKFRVVRLTAAGEVDPTFGFDGHSPAVIGVPMSFDRAPDGSLVVGLEGGRISRFTPGGQLDTTFGAAGTVTLAPPPVDPGWFSIGGTGVIARPLAGGEIVALVVRGHHVTAGSTETRRGLLQRLSPSGQVIGSVTLPDEPGRSAALAVDGQNRVVLALSRIGPPNPTVIQRFSSTLVPDLTFGSSGTDVFNDFAAQSIAFRPDGGILLRDGDGQTSGRIFARLPNGGVDASFGTGGSVLSPYVADVVVDTQGRIVTVSKREYDDQLGYVRRARRFLPTGQPDAAFGQSGVSNLDPNQVFAPTDAAPAADGGVFVSGDVRIPVGEGGRPHPAVAKLRGT